MSLNRTVEEVFLKNFGKKPQVYRSPGRINLIGEHTDYNNGFVLPAAIDKSVYVAIIPSDDKLSKWISIDFNETVEIDLSSIVYQKEHWVNYIFGIVDQFQKKGHKVAPFHCVVAADLPVGAGMSSSAAIEACFAFALNELNQYGYDRHQLALLCQKSENEFIGLRCGIMDMFASLFGKKDHIIRLDCRSLEYEYVPFVLDEFELVLFDTNVKHSLASSEYNVRRQQCEEGVRLLQHYDSSIQSLRDVSKEFLLQHQSALSHLVLKRCSYIINENERLLQACEALLAKDFSTFGKCMFASHEGLQHQYEVSCSELDFLVNEAKKHKEVTGARMMGGGFGGCTINLIQNGFAAEWYSHLSLLYEQQFNKPLSKYEVKIGDGTRLIQN